MDEKMVASIIQHTFKEIARNRIEFFTVGFRLEDLGSFQLWRPKLLHAVKLLIRAIRNDASAKKHRITLSNLFKSRHRLYDFQNSRKYKERFGSWHWK